MRTQDHLLRRMMQPSLPLLVWGVHFFLCYFIATEQLRFGKTATLWLLACASLLALGWLTMLCWRAVRHLHASGNISLLHWASAACAVLGWMGVALSCLPMMLLLS